MKEIIQISINYHVKSDKHKVWADKNQVGTIEHTERHNFLIDIYWN